jgi:PBP1b-binding outer membrane lipoprotein LpoB
MPRPTRTAAVALAAALALSGCGEEPVGSVLVREDTAAVVAAINAKDVSKARQALATLEADVLTAGRLNHLSPDTITQLRAGIATLRADLALITPKPSPTPTVRRTTQAPAREHKDEPRKKKHGKDD